MTRESEQTPSRTQSWPEARYRSSIGPHTHVPPDQHIKECSGAQPTLSAPLAWDFSPIIIYRPATSCCTRRASKCTAAALAPCLALSLATESSCFFWISANLAETKPTLIFFVHLFLSCAISLQLSPAPKPTLRRSVSSDCP